MTEIRGSVAKILNSTQVVINRGSEQGVKHGMVFEILDKNATKIEDPETGKVLGNIDRPKVEVKIVIVDKKLSIAETFKTRRVNRGGNGSSFAGLFSPPNYVDERETLKSEDKAWEDLPEEKSYVKVGDPVRLVENA